MSNKKRENWKIVCFFTIGVRKSACLNGMLLYVAVGRNDDPITSKLQAHSICSCGRGLQGKDLQLWWCGGHQFISSSRDADTGKTCLRIMMTSIKLSTLGLDTALTLDVSLDTPVIIVVLADLA